MRFTNNPLIPLDHSFTQRKMRILAICNLVFSICAAAAVAGWLFASGIVQQGKQAVNALNSIDARSSRLEAALANVETHISRSEARVQRVESLVSASPETPARRFEIRQFMISNHLEQASVPRPIILGDSIVEGALLPSTLSNGGTGSFRSLDLLAMVTALKEKPAWKKVSCAVITVGVNDAMKGYAPGQATRFSKNITELLDQIDKPVVVTTFPYSGQSSIVDNDAAEEMSASILSLQDVPTFDLATFMRNEMADRFPEAFISDGIHLTAEGYAVWTEGIEQAASLCPKGQ